MRWPWKQDPPGPGPVSADWVQEKLSEATRDLQILLARAERELNNKTNGDRNG